MKIVTVEEMRNIEQASVQHGVSLDELQRNAAAAIAKQVIRHPEPYLILVGPGNNGRDALIAAAMVSESGASCSAYLTPKVASEDVQIRLREAGGRVFTHGDDPGLGRLRELVDEAGTIVDGLLGIGSRGGAHEPLASIIEATNAGSSQKTVLAIDLPSGIDADTGEVTGPAILATETLSLGCVKAGLLAWPAADCVGALRPLEIGLPSETYAAIRRELLTPEAVIPLIPVRPRDAHKGTFGSILVVGGSANFVGAPYLTGGAAARCGAGLVTLAVPEWQRVPLVTMLPEATFLPLGEMLDAHAAETNAAIVADVLATYEALAIGPGLGQGDPQTRFVMAILEAAGRQKGLRVVVDADALNALARITDWWTKVPDNCVLTPHPGEMSRLSGLSIGEIGKDRMRVASDAAAKWGKTIVLKGAHTVIAGADGFVWVNPTANPALATGGSGDVLTGIIAGLMAQGADPAQAARAGVFIHTEAGRRALAPGGVTTRLDRMLASDLLPQIPWALAYPMGDGV